MDKGHPHPKWGQKFLWEELLELGKGSKPKLPGSAAHPHLPECFAKDEEFIS